MSHPLPAMICILGFNGRSQQQTQWCWAVVATNFDDHHALQSTRTHAAVVDSEPGQATCVINGDTPIFPCIT